jgi:hypothetical protein
MTTPKVIHLPVVMNTWDDFLRVNRHLGLTREDLIRVGLIQETPKLTIVPGVKDEP